MAKREGRAKNGTASSRSANNEAEAKVRQGYQAAEDPEPQGDGDPGTEQEADADERELAQPS